MDERKIFLVGLTFTTLIVAVGLKLLALDLDLTFARYLYSNSKETLTLISLLGLSNFN